MINLVRITSIEKFKEAKAARDGYIVITDDTGIKIHMPSCANVDIANFREKVLDNKGKHGEYYFVDDLVNAVKEFKAKKCANCRLK